MSRATAAHSSPGPADGVSFTEQQRPLRPNSYRLTHPKNYVGVPLALAADAPAEVLIDKYLVSVVGAAKVGARALGYLTGSDSLTDIGETVVTTARDECGNAVEALATLASNDVRYGRFADELPGMAAVAREPLRAHPGVQLVGSVLSERGQCSLPELVTAAYQQSPSACRGFLIVDEAEVVDAVNAGEPNDPADVLATADAYPAETTYQYKSVLCHLGVLTTPGADSTTLDPQADIWALGPAGQEVVA
jgi:hypothetical protein